MSEVYVVTHVQNRVNLALKVPRGRGPLPPEQRESMAAILRDQAQQLAKLSDLKRFVRVFDAGIEPDRQLPYLLMELVDGRTLADLARAQAKPFTAPEAIRLVRVFASTLGRMHALGLVHGDFKPSNVMLRERGHRDANLVIIDVAARSSWRSPLYLAPEGFEMRGMTPAEDVYALGFVFYELLAGRHPFAGCAGDLIAITRAQIRTEPPPIRELASTVTQELAAIVERMIAKDPARRYANGAEVEDGRGAFTHYGTNDLGLVDEIRPPLGGPIRFTYSPEKWKLSETDGLGRTTSWAYDGRGRVVRETDSLGQIVECSYDAAGNRTEIVAPGGALTSTTFDARRLPMTRTNAAGDVTRFQFDARGRPLRLTDPMGAEWTLEWSPRNDLVGATDPESRATAYAADALGRTIAARDPMGRTLRAERDALGQIIDLHAFDGERFARTYDAEGNLVAQTDSRGRTVRLAYGGLSNLVEHVDPMGYRVRLFYDTETDLVAVENQHRERYRFELDSAGRVAKETSFSGHRRQYVYDAASLVKRVVSGWGRVTEVERDALGRVISTVAKGGERRELLAAEEETFAFDPLGRLVSAKTREAELALDRDVLGRVVRERRDEHAIESTYDRAGYRTARRTSLSHHGTYTRNRAGDLMAMGADWSLGGALRSIGLPQAAMGGFELKFARDKNGQEIARRLPGGVSAVWTRDAFGKPVQQRVVTGAGADRPGIDVLRKGYAWSAPTEIAGITSYEPSSGAIRSSSTYDYDPRGHLVRQVMGTGEVIHRQADPAGNLFRTPDARDRVYGKGGVLQKAGGTTYTFDDDGFLSEKVLSDGARWVYSWSAAGRLREVTRPDGKKVAFAYDALGRRVRKAFDGRLTEYVWDGSDLVHERTTDAGGERAPLVTWLFEPGTFSPVAKIEGRKRFGVVSDHLGVPTALTTEAGKIAWQAQLDVYGVGREETPVGGVAAKEDERTRNPWRFPGQYEDEETGLYYNRFRYYDPEIGRYLSEDPIGLSGGLAAYGYVHDPASWLDPLGLAGTFTPGTWTSPETGEVFDVYQQDIDWNLPVTKKGGGTETNLDRALRGDAPFVVKNGKYHIVNLHHAKQDARGPLWELSKDTHNTFHGTPALHPHLPGPHPEFPVDRRVFDIEREAYWRERASKAKAKC